MTKTLSMTEARGRLTELPEEFLHDKNQSAVAITRRGKPVLAVIPWKEYERFRETLEIVTDEATLESIRRGMEDVRKKRTTSLAKVRKELGI